MLWAGNRATDSALASMVVPKLAQLGGKNETLDFKGRAGEAKQVFGAVVNFLVYNLVFYGQFPGLNWSALELTWANPWNTRSHEDGLAKMFASGTCGLCGALFAGLSWVRGVA